MSKSLAALLLLLALAGLLALVFWLGGPREVDLGDGSRSADSSATSRPDAAHPDLSAASVGDELGATPARETAAEPTPDPVGTAPSPASAATDATLLVRVVSKSTREPLARIRVNLFRTEVEGGDSSTNVPGTSGSLSQRPITGEDGRVEFAVPSGIACALWTRAEDGQAGFDIVEVPALGPGERREQTIELAAGFDLRFVAKFVSDEDREPIAGARARVVRSDGSFSSEGWRWRSQVLSETATGADGILDLSLESWKRAHVRVEADGFGMALVVPVPGHETQEQAWVVPLFRGATLDARVLDAGGAPMPGASVRLSGNGYELNRPHREEFGDDGVQLPETSWTGEVGPDGRSVLRDLPPDLGLTVEILAGKKVVRREADPLELQAGQVLEREWRIGAGCILRGLALDQEDRPVPRLEVWLAKAFGTSSRYFDASESTEIVSKTGTDDAGRFELRDVQPGTWYLGPAASTPSWEEAPQDGTAPFAVAIEVAGSGSQEVTLRVHRGLFIRGRVLDARGTPVEHANVHGSMEGADWGPQIDSKKDGSFALGPLAPGKLFLIAVGGGTDAPSDAVPAEAGAKDVLLRLRIGSKIRGRVVDRRTGEACQAEVMLVPEIPSEGIFGREIGLRTRDGGMFEMEGREPGRYGVAACTDDGRFGAVAGVDLAAGTVSDEITIPVSEGGRLKLRYEGASERAHVMVRLSGIPVDWGTDLERGKSVERPAPAGTLVLELVAGSDGKPFSRSVDLAAGEEKEVVLRDGE
jgi:protocatechuate 3,4-dioxygenase beta subunit